MKTITANAPTCDPQTGCKLFDLPAEIRDYIWALVLTVNPPNERGTVILALTRHQSTPTVLSLLQTCRLILQEAEGIFYASNHLELHNTGHAITKFSVLHNTRISSVAHRSDHFSQFIATLRPSRLSAIKAISIVVHGKYEAITGTLKALRLLKGLETAFLHLREFSPLASSFDNMPRELSFWRFAAGKLPTGLLELRFCVQVDEKSAFSEAPLLEGKAVVAALEKAVVMLEGRMDRSGRSSTRFSVALEHVKGDLILG